MKALGLALARLLCHACATSSAEYRSSSSGDFDVWKGASELREPSYMAGTNYGGTPFESPELTARNASTNQGSQELNHTTKGARHRKLNPDREDNRRTSTSIKPKPAFKPLRAPPSELFPRLITNAINNPFPDSAAVYAEQSVVTERHRTTGGANGKDFFHDREFELSEEAQANAPRVAADYMPEAWEEASFDSDRGIRVMLVCEKAQGEGNCMIRTPPESQIRVGKHVRKDEDGRTVVDRMTIDVFATTMGRAHTREKEDLEEFWERWLKQHPKLTIGWHLKTAAVEALTYTKRAVRFQIEATKLDEHGKPVGNHTKEDQEIPTLRLFGPGVGPEETFETIPDIWENVAEYGGRYGLIVRALFNSRHTFQFMNPLWFISGLPIERRGSGREGRDKTNGSDSNNSNLPKNEIRKRRKPP